MSGSRWPLLTLALLLTIAGRASAIEQELIDKAVDAGKAYLKQHVGRGGQGEQVGATALAGLTLLECGVAPTDPAVSAALETVRGSSVGLDHTYSIALSIMLLDRAGDPGDVALIESLTVRLLAGQNGEGGWSYNCPTIDEGEVRRLSTHIKLQNELRTGKTPAKTDPKEEKPPRRTAKDLPREIQQQLIQVQRFGRRRSGGDDNSNTQFATLGLWVARRHGLPVDDALLLVERRFRLSQGPDGGWAYHMPRGGPAQSTATMTCAGVLGLAVSYGVHNDQEQGGAKKAVRNPVKDDGLKAGLLVLSTAVGQPLGKGRRGLIPQVSGKAYYFLWSLERVAVILDLKTIGKKDWFAWGAEILVANQQADGSWRGDYAGSAADTCFALLFLRRANVASDLTASFGGKFQDPGEITLKTGGVGGGALTGKKEDGLKAPLQGDAKAEKSGPKEKEPKAAPIPSKPAEGKAARSGEALIKAEGKREREVALKELRETRGQDYTDALADAIRLLEGDARNDARHALAERLTRMTARTLATYLEDEDPEIRRAAALASGMKDARENIPVLIERLNDTVPTVVRATHAALKAMTGRDLGPGTDATPQEQAKAVAAWKTWWKEQQK